MTPQSPVSEGIGSVSVCVNVTNADSIPNGGVTIEVSTTTLGSNPATRKKLYMVLCIHSCSTVCDSTDRLGFPCSSANVDYRLEQEVLTFMPGTTLNCTSISLIDDDLVEGNTPEDIFVRIQSPDQQLITINTDSDIAIISIEDNDSMTLMHDMILIYNCR